MAASAWQKGLKDALLPEEVLLQIGHETKDLLRLGNSEAC